jgi:hypothetical protein
LSGEQFINDILLNVSSVISGKIPMRDEKISKIYDDQTSQLLLRIAINSYNLFKQQASNIIENTITRESTIKNNKYFIEFMGTKSKNAVAVNWPGLQKESNQFCFNSFTKVYLEEMQTVGIPSSNNNIKNDRPSREMDKYVKEVANKIQTFYKDKNAMLKYFPKFTATLGKHLGINSTQSSASGLNNQTNDKQPTSQSQPGMDPSSAAQTNPAETENSEQTTDEKANNPFLHEGKYVYSLGNLFKASGEGDDLSKELVSSLEDLANHVRKATEIDWGKFTQSVAGALGGPKVMQPA